MNLKRMFQGLAIGAAFLLPLSASAMAPITDSELSGVTGQAGVSINLDARVDLKADVVAWGDLDGFTATNVNVTSGADAAGWIGLSDLVVDNLRVRADQTLLKAEWFQKHTNTTEATDFQTAAETLTTNVTAFATAYGTGVASSTFPALAGLDPTSPESILANAATLSGAPYSLGTEVGAVNTAVGTFTTAKNAILVIAGGGNTDAVAFLTVADEKGSGTFTPFAPLTIDVATDATTNHGGVANTTFVRIGLGSLQVAMASMDATVDLGPDTGYVGDGSGVANGVPNLKYQLGSLYLANMSLRIGGNSYVDIFNARGGSAQGVNIVTDVIIKQFKIGTLSWGDADGVDWSFTTDTEDVYGTHTTDATLQTPAVVAAAGYVGLKDLEIGWLEIAGQIDIDVATDDALGTYTGTANLTYVNIGLDNLTINMDGLTATAALGSAKGNLNQELGELYVSNAEIIVDGALAIGARADGTQGVTIDLSNLSVSISQGLTVSWGDLDGVGGTSAEGYVGLTGLNIEGLALQGKVTIDVATIRTGDPDTGATIEDMMYLGYRENNLSPTIVHIGIGTGDATDDTMDASFAFLGDALGVSMTSISGAVAFGTANTLVGANTLGNFYVGGVQVGVNGWVDIAAH